MNQLPFFSILIPVYNASDSIDRCLSSVFSQNFSSFEVVLVDDGSGDDSLSICRKWQSRYQGQIKLFHQENSGAVMARRKLLQNAAGTYLWFVDADDEISPDALPQIADLLHRFKADMLLFDWQTETENGHWVYEHQLPDCATETLFTEKEPLYRYAVAGYMNSLWNKVFHRNCIDTGADYSPYRNLRKGNDRLQMLPLLTAAQSVCYVKKPYYLYHYNPSGLTRTFGQHTLDAVTFGLQLLDSYTRIWGSSDHFRNELALLRNRHVYQLLTQAWDVSAISGGYTAFQSYYTIITANELLMKDYDYLPLQAVDCYARDVTKAVRLHHCKRCYTIILVRKKLHRIKEMLH